MSGCSPGTQQFLPSLLPKERSPNIYVNGILIFKQLLTAHRLFGNYASSQTSQKRRCVVNE